MSIRIKPVEPAVKSSLQRRPFGYVLRTDPRYQAVQSSVRSKVLLDEAQRNIQKR